MDILIALLIALTQGFTAFLAWRVTVKPLSPRDTKRRRKYTAAFVTATAVSFLATGVATYLARKAQKALPGEVASQVIVAIKA
jgi:hypothetical protein